jgi:hypothetical protein
VGSQEVLSGEAAPLVTAIDLLSFTATGDGPAVEVSWETAQEIDNLGFNLYRGPSREGPFTKLT